MFRRNRMRWFWRGARKFVFARQRSGTGKAVVIGVGVGEFSTGVRRRRCGLRPGEKQHKREGEAHKTRALRAFPFRSMRTGSGREKL